jgi:signal transduction histidine kinase/DNA-binding NarL/FixJ family response regulator/sugar lactone lactonase YvrE
MLGTRGGGAFLHDSDRDVFLPIEAKETGISGSDRDVYATFFDSRDRIWIGCPSGLQVVKMATHPGNGFVVHASVSGLGLVNGFTETEDGVWVVSSVLGALRLNESGSIEKRFSLDQLFGSSSRPIEATGIASDSRGRLWVWSLQHGIAVVDPDSTPSFKQFLRSGERGASNITVLSIAEISNDVFWIGTVEGLFEIDFNSGDTREITPDYLKTRTPSVLSIAKPRNGTIWLGTLYGPMSATQRELSTASTLNTALSSDSINTLAEADDGIWVGTERGLNLLEQDLTVKATLNELTSPSISNSTVMALLPEQTGIWIGTYRGGLNFLDYSSNTTRSFQNDPSDDRSIAADGVTSILRTSNGALLIGTYGGGLNKLNERNQSFTRYQSDSLPGSAISDDRVISLYQDSLGNIFVGTENGLNIFNENKATFETIKSDNSNGLKSDFIWSMFEDSNRDLWIGSYRGGITVWRFKERATGIRTFERPPTEIGEGVNSVIGIAEDPEGLIWISHNGGLVRIASDFSYSRGFTTFDGLSDTEFNVGATLLDSAGNIYFGGNRGINIVDATHLPTSTVAPAVAVSEIRINNQRKIIRATTSSTIPLNLVHTDTLLEVSFFADEIAYPEGVTYAYMLDGLSPTWVIGKDRHKATFTTLPPGDYTLRLAASGSSGLWNWNALTLPVHVAPPPWKSRPAYVAYALITACLLFFAIYMLRSRSKRQSNRRIELERVVQERTRQLDVARRDAESANAAKSLFLATMSHEIRTPLHGMLGMVGLLQRTHLDSQQKQYTHRALQSGRLLLGLINDILDFSKLEADKVEFNETLVDVNTLIGDLCLLQATTIGNVPVTLSYYPISRNDSIVLCDDVKLQQCINNLLSNAIKFTPQGCISLSVRRIQSTDCPSDHLSIAIEDQGIGMSQTTLSRVFDDFTQADASITREYGGTGLGLSITKRFVDLMGGSIIVESEQNVGTTVKLSVPVEFQPEKTSQDQLSRKSHAVVLGEESEMTDSLLANCRALGLHGFRRETLSDTNELTFGDVVFAPIGKELLLPTNLRCHIVYYANKSSPDGHWIAPPFVPSLIQESIDHNADEATSKLDKVSPPVQSFRCLVAEDVALNQEIASEMLSSLGGNVSVATNGHEVLTLHRQIKFDVIFMDCQMPKLDGLSATRKIRLLEQSQPNLWPRVSIIGLTAGANQNTLGDCLNAGMDSVLFKPFSIRDLRETLLTCSGFTPSLLDHPSSSLRSSAEPSSTSPSTSITRSKTTLSDMVLFDLAALSTDDPARFVGALIDNFLLQATKRISRLGGELDIGDFLSAAETIHALKSMSLNLGATDFTSFLKDLEKSVDKRVSVNADEVTNSATTLLSSYGATAHEWLGNFA